MHVLFMKRCHMILCYEGLLEFSMFTSKTTHKNTVVEEVMKIINRKPVSRNKIRDKQRKPQAKLPEEKKYKDAK